MHDVPLAAYTEDGLSLIASKVGSPKILDNETSNMCMDSWGRSSFARAIIEIDATKEPKQNVSIAIPNVEEGGFLKSNIQVEYEWTPPRCNECCVFGHTNSSCPKKISQTKVDTTKQGGVGMDDEGFEEVTRKKKATKQGFPMKNKQKFEYRPKVFKQDESDTASKTKTEVKV
ncbi:MAG: hypothetical protein Q8755_02490, partial [Candidatus Phytoplasma australasiaticum]|nr:hypothetical protein [Candidatus Phytoplasma australasiaticum]